MGWFKSKSKIEDVIFSRVIRIRDSFTCVRCGRKHEYGLNAKGEYVSDTLDNSHFWGRAKWSTRFDPENCDSLCKIPCHMEWENEKGEGRAYWNFKLKQLGQHRFDTLRVKAHLIGKKDRALAKIVAEQYLKSVLEVFEKGGA